MWCVLMKSVVLFYNMINLHCQESLSATQETSIMPVNVYYDQNYNTIDKHSQ